MGAFDEIYEDLEAEIDREDFEARVAAKIEEMGELMDEETAAMLVAHELDGDRPVPIEEVSPEMERVTVLGVVQHVGEIRTFDRDDGAQGSVLNIDLADESGQVRAAFWDEMATAAAERLDRGDTLRLKARPRDGYDGLELSVTDLRREEDLDVGVSEPEPAAIDEVTPGMEGVILTGEVLRVDPPRTFERDDGTEGRVATVVLGDDTGAIDVTLWGDATAVTEELAPGDGARIEGGSVRERDGRTEVHVGGRARLEPADVDVSYDPVGAPIDGLAEGDSATITGVVRATDPVRTFDRDDGSEGQVRNVEIQDQSGSMRVALWGDRADIDLAPGDEVTCIDVQIQEGYRDDLEASANWRSTIVPRGGEVADAADDEATTADDADETVEFTGTVVQPGDPIVLDDGTETVHVTYGGDVQLGARVTVVGHREGERIRAESLEPAAEPR